MRAAAGRLPPAAEYRAATAAVREANRAAETGLNKNTLFFFIFIKPLGQSRKTCLSGLTFLCFKSRENFTKKFFHKAVINLLKKAKAVIQCG